VDYDRSAAIAEERVGAVAERHIFILQFRIGLAFGVDGEVQHVAGMMALGVLQAVLLAVGIEMRAGRLEVGGVAFGVLMEVNGVFAGGKIVQAKLQAYTWPLLPECDRPNGLALGVFDFDLGFGCAREGENDHCDGRGQRGEDYRFHAGDYS